MSTSRSLYSHSGCVLCGLRSCSESGLRGPPRPVPGVTPVHGIPLNARLDEFAHPRASSGLLAMVSGGVRQRPRTARGMETLICRADPFKRQAGGLGTLK